MEDNIHNSKVGHKGHIQGNTHIELWVLSQQLLQFERVLLGTGLSPV
jgi:hypothetical protein